MPDISQNPVDSGSTSGGIGLGGTSYTLSFARNNNEVEEALRLRHDVYNLEYLGQPHPLGIDRDNYDQQCRHLVVRHNPSGSLAGTYRINPGGLDGYYTATEFSIGTFLATPGRKLEIGRACINADYRTGAVFNLLIQGILNFAHQTESRHIFGCCSIPESLGLETLVYCMHRLKRFHVLPETREIHPLMPPERPDLPECIESEQQAWKAIQRNSHSPLFYYLLLGAKAAEVPCHDPIFHTYDFFMLLDLADMTPFGQRLMASAITMSEPRHVPQ
jgi:putative hemolysin